MMTENKLYNYLLGKWYLSFRGAQIGDSMQEDFHPDCESKTYYQFHADQTGDDQFYIQQEGNCEEQEIGSFAWELRDNTLIRLENIAEDNLVAVAEYDIFQLSEQEMEWQIRIEADEEQEEMLYIMRWKRA